MKPFVLLLAACGAGAACGAVDLVRDSVLRYRVETGGSVVRELAAGEYYRVLQAVTGCAVDDAAQAAAPGVIRLEVREAEGNDAYSIAFGENSIVLTGNRERSACFAMMDLLERLGCRWFWPGDDGEFLPAATPTLSIEPFALSTTAALPFRKLSTHPDLKKNWFFVHNRLNPDNGADDSRYRLYWGQPTSWGGHSFNWIWPEDCTSASDYFAKYPEQHALKDGKRVSSQHCYTNPDTIRTFVDWIVRFWDEHPGIETLSLVPKDSSVHCTCAECARTDASTCFFTFLNTIVAGAEARRPGHRYATIAYSFYRPVPKVKLHPSVSLSYCMYNRCYKHYLGDGDDTKNPAAIAEFDAWTEVLGHAPDVYGYHFDCWGGTVPYTLPIEGILQQEIRWARDRGVSLWMTEYHAGWGTTGDPPDMMRNYAIRFQSYAAARLLWDPDLDLAALRDDWCRRVYGPAARPMDEYLVAMEEAWRAGGHVSGYNASPSNHCDTFITPGLMDTCDACFARALTALGTGDVRARMEVELERTFWLRWRDVRTWHADRFVSSDRSYGESVADDAHRLTDLVEAVRAATSGTTVWVKDGFVCASGGGGARTANDGLSRIVVPAGVTVRSESGNWRGGATIRGDGTMRCVGFAGSSGVSRLIGFVLEDGTSTTSGDKAGGGGVLGGCKDHEVVGCLIRNNRADRGGGADNVTLRDCIVTNNVANTAGGGGALVAAYDSLVCGNSAGGKNFGGGGFYNSAPVSNCVICCNLATVNLGGGTLGCNVIDCVITNNTAQGWGGGTSGGWALGTRPNSCVIAGNNGSRGGGVSGSAVTNCLICSNEARSGDGGGVYNFQGSSAVYVEGCVISNNTITSGGNGGGVFRAKAVRNSLIVGNSTASGCNGGGLCQVPLVEDCMIVGNTAQKYGGGLYSCSVCSNVALIGNSAVQCGGGAYDSTLCDCRVVSNRMTKTGSNSIGGGGICNGSATRTVFTGNVAVGDAGGGAAKDAALVSCVVSNNSAGRYGGGAWGGSSINCTFVFNVEGPNGSIGAGGGAVQGGTHYNALFLNNTAGNYGSAAYSATCYNCTAYSNTNTCSRGNWSGGSLSECKLVNCLSYANVGGGDDGVMWASNSCVQVSSLADVKYVDCTNVNPRLDAEFRPHARVCRKAGLVFDWMTDEADVRSKDLADNPRIAPGKEKPDMGCYETKLRGLMMSVR